MLKERALLKTVVSILDKYNIKYCLMWGTLLGVIRDNKIIEKDDVDIAIFSQFWKDDSLWHSFFIDVYKAGYQVKDLAYNYICINSQNPELKNLHIDIYLLHEEGSKYKYKGSERLFEFPKNFFTVLDTVEFDNYTFKVPRNPKEIIEYNYGKDWLVPKAPENTEYFNTKKIIDEYETLYTFNYIEPIYKKDLK